MDHNSKTLKLYEKSTVSLRKRQSVGQGVSTSVRAAMKSPEGGKAGVNPNNQTNDGTIPRNDRDEDFGIRLEYVQITDVIPFYKGSLGYIIVLLLVVPYNITLFTNLLYQPFKLAGIQIPSQEHTSYSLQYSHDFPAIHIRIAVLTGYSVILELVQIAMIGFMVVEKVVLKKFAASHQDTRQDKESEICNLDLFVLLLFQIVFLYMLFNYTTTYIRDQGMGLAKDAIAMITCDFKVLFIIYFILFLMKMKYVRLYFPIRI